MGLRGLKILVIGMGVLLAAGFVVLLVGLGTRIAALYGPQEPVPPYALDLPVGPGDTLEGMAAVGERLAVLVETADGRRRILVVDPAQGRLIGTLAPPSAAAAAPAGSPPAD